MAADPRLTLVPDIAAPNALHYAAPAPARVERAGDAGAEEGERLIGIAELARRIGMGKTWVKGHLAGLPARRNLSGTPRWRLADLDAWIKDRPEYGGI